MFKVYVYKIDNPNDKTLLSTSATVEKAEQFVDFMQYRINYQYDLMIEEEQNNG